MKQSSGFTLVETVITIVILSIAIIGTIVAVTVVVRHSSDPMILSQGIAIAESYLEEIQGKAFPTSTPCPGSPGANRSTYSNVCDYNGISQVPTDELGNAISGLSHYNVAVSVVTNSGANLSGLTGGTQIVRIDVTVTNPQMPSMTHSVYRANY